MASGIVIGPAVVAVGLAEPSKTLTVVVVADDAFLVVDAAVAEPAGTEA